MGRKINIKKRETHEKTLEIERGDEGEVRAVGRIVYTDNQEGWNTRCPSIGSAYPDDAALRLKKISMEGMEGDMVRVTLYYELPRETSFEFGGGEEVEYSMDYSCSEQPLLTHPNFQDIDGEEKDALMAMASGASPKDTFGKEDKVIEDVVKSEAGKKAMEKMRKGQVSFLCPGGVFSVTSTVQALSMAGVGKKGAPGSGAPAVSGKYDWIKEGVSGRRTGTGNWRQTVSWRLSGPDGWESDLY